LATCKAQIRAHASVGDIVIGTGCAKRRRSGYLVFALYVAEVITFDRYWSDPRFRAKRPDFHGSRMQAYGDNIYHSDRSPAGWFQANSFHSLPTGERHMLTLAQDTRSATVLVGWDFKYWGGSGPRIPTRFRDYEGIDICAGRGHKNKFPPELVTDLVNWIQETGESGLIAPPLEWRFDRRGSR
jgi:hypothetical protein